MEKIALERFRVQGFRGFAGFGIFGLVWGFKILGIRVRGSTLRISVWFGI